MFSSMIVIDGRQRGGTFLKPYSRSLSLATHWGWGYDKIERSPGKYYPSPCRFRCHLALLRVKSFMAARCSISDMFEVWRKIYVKKIFFLTKEIIKSDGRLCAIINMRSLYNAEKYFLYVISKRVVARTFRRTWYIVCKMIRGKNQWTNFWFYLFPPVIDTVLHYYIFFRKDIPSH